MGENGENDENVDNLNEFEKISKIDNQEHNDKDIEDDKEENKIIKKNKKKLKPARAQVDIDLIKNSETSQQSGNVFNIWYSKWSGGDSNDKSFSQKKAEGRCNIAKDSGYTKADKIIGSYFCLYFARGLCPYGKECKYLHRLPTDFDMPTLNVDCFGRDKFSDYRDDMGGVGTFLRQNRTLYVGRIDISDNIEEVVARHFGEWGDIERIRVLPGRGVAFVTYKNEVNAQFAKESMAHQSLDNNEVLNVRWATTDPNPLSILRDKRRAEEQAADAIRKLLPKEYVDELEGKVSNSEKKRKIDQTFHLKGYQPLDKVWFSTGENALNPIGKTKSINDSTTSMKTIQENQSVLSNSDSKQLPSNSIISTNTLETLKHLNNLKPINDSNSNKPPDKNDNSLLNHGLVSYESDDE